MESFLLLLRGENEKFGEMTILENFNLLFSSGQGDATSRDGRVAAERCQLDGTAGDRDEEKAEIRRGCGNNGDDGECIFEIEMLWRL